MTRDLRGDALSMIEAALAAVEPERLVGEALAFKDGNLTVAGRSYSLSAIGDIYVVGAGKAAVPMAAAVEDTLEERISAGTVVVKDGFGKGGTREIEVLEAAHPVPDERGSEAARKLLGLAGEAGEGDLVICLLSGGGSALLALPAEGLTLEDIRRATDVLVKSGAAIGEINAVRKHITGASGGRLAAAASPATVVTLIISDVIGDDLAAIASGPTFPDGTTYADALEIVKRYGLKKRMPAEVMAHLEAGAAGRIPETPRGRWSNPAFARCHWYVLGSNRTALDAAVAKADALGYRVVREEEPLEGEAREEARRLVDRAREAVAGRGPGAAPLCLLAGGETTVTVTGAGTGGRAQEFALAAAPEMEGLEGALLFAFGTDGTDGPTDAAGAFADGSTVERARTAGLDPAAHLAENNAYPFFKELGDLIMTGPTGTNVNDIYGLLVAAD